MNFLIDPAAAPGPIVATVDQPAVKCAIGLSFDVFAVSTNAGGALAACPITGLLRNGSGQAIPYTLGCAPGGVGQGTGPSDPAVELGVAGAVVLADYQDAAVGGGYSDNITFQIVY